MPPQIDKTIPLSENRNFEQLSSMDHDQNVFNIQTYLLTLLFMQWFVFVITLGVGIYAVSSGNTVDILIGIESLIPILILVIYYSFGLIVTYKQHRIGLLIFASIGVVLFIAGCILIGYIIIAVIALDIGFGNTGQGNEFFVFLGVLIIVVVIVTILSLKFSFDLAKSIKRNDYSTV